MKRSIIWDRCAVLRRSSSRFRSLQFSTCEPRALLTGFILEPVQVIRSEQALAPMDLVPADVNRDGDLDLVALRNGHIFVLDNEQGDFVLRPFATQLTPGSDSLLSNAAIAGIGDMDQDEDADLIAVVDRSYATWIENMDGRGTFDKIHWVATIDRSVRPFDVDRDGDLDLVASEIVDGGVSWYENSPGYGIFSRVHRVSVATPGRLHLADLDGDRDVDFLVQSSSQLVAYQNRGSRGDLWKPTVVLEGAVNRLRLMQITSIDGNEAVDVVLASSKLTVIHDIGNAFAGTTARTTEVSWNAGTGQLLQLADLNGDRRFDALFNENGVLGWSPQLADESFGSFRPIHSLHPAVFELMPKDWDGDQDIDLLLQWQGTVQWIENRDGQGDFDTRPIEQERIDLLGETFVRGELVSRAIHSVSWNRPIHRVRMVDWNGDGLSDVMTESFANISGGPVSLRWYRNEAGRFQAPQTLFTGPLLSVNSNTLWTVADVDGDRLPDLALVTNNHLTVYRHNTTEPVLVSLPINANHTISTIELVDIDHDGDRDVTWVQEGPGWPRERSVYWSENIDRAGTFRDAAVLAQAVGEASREHWADLTGDGHSDFVIYNAPQGVVRLWTFDSGTRRLISLQEQKIESARDLQIADLDGDLRNDLVEFTSNGAVVAHWNRRNDLPFEAEILFDAPINSRQKTWVGAGDLDADGDLDLLLTDGRLLWLENRKDENRWDLRSASDDVATFHADFLEASDIDGDTDLDAIAVTGEDSRIIILSNRHVQLDWTQDGKLDRADLDAVCAALVAGTTHLRYDVDANGRFDRDDVDTFRRTILGTPVGDIDDDGRLSPTDLILLMQRGKWAQAQPLGATWSEGDFDCNGQFDTRDLMYAFSTSGYSVPPTELPQVLEPLTIYNGVDTLTQFRRFPLALQADIDSDGDDDLLLENSGFTTRRTWYRNDGPHQPFVHHAEFEWPSINVRSTAADFDGDGDVDWLIPATPAFWLENVDGKGHFETRHELSISNLHFDFTPRFEDWDHDGDVDMLALTRDQTADPNQVASLVLFDNVDGRGRFERSAVVTTRTGASRRSFGQPFDLADFDHDGWTDVVVNNDAWYRNRQGSMTNLERVPIASLSSPMNPLEEVFANVEAADLDHDGDLDLIQQSANNQLVFSYNDGLGRYTHFTSHFVADRFYLLDTDHNGRWELLLPDAWSEAEANWTDPNLAGFEHFQSLESQIITIPPVLLDRDSDQRTDLVVSSPGKNGVLEVLLHAKPKDVSWQTVTPLLSNSQLYGVRARDIDHDGRLDLVALSKYDPTTQWFRNLGDGKWSEPTPLDSAMDSGLLLRSPIDLDNDSDVDFVSNVDWYENVPDGDRSIWKLHTLPRHAVTWQDMDADGDLDLVSDDRWIANQRGIFSMDSATLVPLQWGDRVMDGADFDGDGSVDLLISDLNGHQWVLYEKPNRPVTRQLASQSSGLIWDIDHDGDPDVVSPNTLWNENVDGHFETQHPLQRKSPIGKITDQILADLDGDGFQELVSAWADANDLTIESLVDTVD